MTTGTLRLTAAGLFALALFFFVVAAAQSPTAAARSLGHRGLQRQQARARSLGFRLFDAPVRWLAQHMARLPIAQTRARLTLHLQRSGDYMGLDADELLALIALGAVLGAVMGFEVGGVLGWGAFGVLPGVVLGGWSPYLRVTDNARRRDRALDHALPPAIDLLSLCMSAGLDFNGGLQLLARETQLRDSTLQAELQRILQGLQTGQTRRQALLELAARSSATSVHELVRAVVQADEKGTPLATVLEIQAQMLRMRRSVLAEEAAARAAVLLVLPLLLLMGCILIVMLGPFIVKGIGL